MRKIWTVPLTMASLAAGWALGNRGRPYGMGHEAISYHTGVSIEQVQALASLVTARVDVADVQETQLQGYTGGTKAALLIKGDFLLGTDLSRAKFASVDPSARTGVLVLVPPAIASPRLDHERTRVFAITESGLWLLTPGNDRTAAAALDRAFRDAQRFVAAAGSEPTLQSRSRRQAEAVLSAFFRTLGWDITIRWQD